MFNSLFLKLTVQKLRGTLNSPLYMLINAWN